jgi:hypothetical protein
MTCRRGDNMYSSKISNSMTINNKTGETKLNEVSVKVDGFSEPELLEKAKEDYNNDKSLKKPKYAKDWPEGTWYDLYYDMFRKLLKRRKMAYK